MILFIRLTNVSNESIESKLSDNSLLELLSLKGKKFNQVNDSGSWDPLVKISGPVPANTGIDQDILNKKEIEQTSLRGGLIQ